jgi:hypothetical protein
LTKESLERILAAPLPQANEADLAKSYKLLKKFKAKMGLNSHLLEQEVDAEDLDNTDSYRKVQNLIFSQAHRYVSV